MIDSISDVSLYQVISSTSSNRSSTTSTFDTISDILSNYDASSLSSDDAKEIVEALSSAGISPSKELEEAMSNLGFDAKEVGSLAGVGPQGGMPPPPPPNGEGSEQDSISSILDILLNEEDESNSSTSFETILDYTSRIISLNENAKDEVKQLLENYSPENTELSRQDAKTVVQNSLSQILNDSTNYNTTSFYG